MNRSKYICQYLAIFNQFTSQQNEQKELLIRRNSREIATNCQYSKRIEALFTATVKRLAKMHEKPCLRVAEYSYIGVLKNVKKRHLDASESVSTTASRSRQPSGVAIGDDHQKMSESE